LIGARVRWGRHGPSARIHARFSNFEKFVDRLDARLGYALAVIVWDSAAVARTPLQFQFGRFALGLGEAGIFLLPSG
jgi:hypothetical protein